MTKKKTNRSSRKYPALDTKTNLKIRNDLYDFDYLNQLTDKEKEWLNNFSEEYNGADFRHNGKTLHKTKKLKSDCYNRNNARNRCVYGKAKAQGQVFDYALPDEQTYDGEEALNDIVDQSNGVMILIQDLISKFNLPDTQDVKDNMYQLFVKYNFSLDKVNTFLMKRVHNKK